LLLTLRGVLQRAVAIVADPEVTQNPSYIIHLKATLFRPFGPGRRRFSGWISLDADVRLDFGISFSFKDALVLFAR